MSGVPRCLMCVSSHVSLYGSTLELQRDDQERGFCGHFDRLGTENTELRSKVASTASRGASDTVRITTMTILKEARLKQPNGFCGKVFFNQRKCFAVLHRYGRRVPPGTALVCENTTLKYSKTMMWRRKRPRCNLLVSLTA